MGVVTCRPTFGGLLFALLFWWESLSPTLLPRAWLNQAALSALCLTVGYAFGWAWRPGRAGSRPGRGFDRDVLVVASSTGTGWIDPDAAEALVQLHHGSTATA